MRGRRDPYDRPSGGRAKSVATETGAFAPGSGMPDRGAGPHRTGGGENIPTDWLHGSVYANRPYRTHLKAADRRTYRRRRRKVLQGTRTYPALS